MSGDAEDNKKKIFYCEVCDVTFNDSLSLVDHLNGKKHNRVLGMNMKVKKVGYNEVLARLNQMAVTVEEKKKGEEPKSENNESEEQEKPEEEKSKEKKIEKNEKNEEPEEDEFDEFLEDEEELKAMAAMGIPTEFTSTKRT